MAVSVQVSTFNSDHQVAQARQVICPLMPNIRASIDGSIDIGELTDTILRFYFAD